MSKLPASTVYPLEIVERVIVTGQRRRELREGQPNLLAAILLGCALRPIQLANFASPGALDLINETRHDPSGSATPHSGSAFAGLAVQPGAATA